MKLASSYRNWVDISADVEIGSLHPKKHVPQAVDNSSMNTFNSSNQTHKTMKRITLLLFSGICLATITTTTSIAGQSVNCVERTDSNGKKAYFKAESATSGVEGMSSETIPEPKRFFTVDLPGGENYYKNRNGGMSFFSGECIY